MSDYQPRLIKKYHDDVVPQLMKDFSLENIMQVPKLDRIVVNMGLGEAVQNAKLIESATEELMAITGRKPVVTRAKKSIAGFKLREGMPIGVMATLRGEQMYDFLDRLITIALPRTAGLQGYQSEGVRRPRELHAGRSGANHLPRDQLRQSRSNQRHEHHVRDHGRN